MPIYNEEEIAISGALWEDEANTIPISFDGKQLIVFIIKSDSNQKILSITDEMITKVDNTYAFILQKDKTKDLIGNYRMQFNLIENGNVIKSIISGLTIKQSENVFNN